MSAKFSFWLNKCQGKKPEHLHNWVLQYKTGNAMDGKSDVVRCDCGQWAVYHRNPSCGEIHKYHLLNSCLK